MVATNNPYKSYLPTWLIAVAASLLLAEYLVIYLVFQMAYGFLFWLYVVVPALVVANTVCCIWLVAKTKKFRWLFISVIAWFPICALLILSAMVSH